MAKKTANLKNSKMGGKAATPKKGGNTGTPYITGFLPKK